MIDSLRDLLVVSDMDNTLLTAKEGVPACNRATIELFRALGGRFTVATGRPPASIRAALGGTRLSCPAIACGGSVLYDLEADRALEKSFLPLAAAREAVTAVMEQFPDMGVDVMVEEGRVYVVQANRYTQAHLRDEEIGCIMCPLEQVPCNWAKVMFAADPIAILNLQKFARGLHFDGMYFLPPTPFILRSCPRGSARPRPCAGFAPGWMCPWKIQWSSAIITTTST